MGIDEQLTDEEKGKLLFVKMGQDRLYNDAIVTMNSKKRDVGSEQLTIALGFLKLEIMKREILEKYN